MQAKQNSKQEHGEKQHTRIYLGSPKPDLSPGTLSQLLKRFH